MPSRDYIRGYIAGYKQGKKDSAFQGMLRDFGRPFRIAGQILPGASGAEYEQGCEDGYAAAQAGDENEFDFDDDDDEE